jgi:hypothetical protein
MMPAKKLQVAELITQAQFVVGLELIAMAGSADALKVFSAVRITSPQTPDQPSRDNVIDMALDPNLSKPDSARLYFAMPTQCCSSMLPPPFP